MKFTATLLWTVFCNQTHSLFHIESLSFEAREARGFPMDDGINEKIVGLDICDLTHFNDFTKKIAKSGKNNAAVYLVKKKENRNPYIAKKLFNVFNDASISFDFFRQELIFTSRFKDLIPQIANVDCYFIDPHENGYIVKELVHRTNVDHIMQRISDGSLSEFVYFLVPEIIFNWIVIVLNVHYLQYANLDLKPENFGFNRDWNFKWFDQGTLIETDCFDDVEECYFQRVKDLIRLGYHAKSMLNSYSFKKGSLFHVFHHLDNNALFELNSKYIKTDGSITNTFRIEIKNGFEKEFSMYKPDYSAFLDTLWH